jgi:hypothetical protein
MISYEEAVSLYEECFAFFNGSSSVAYDSVLGKKSEELFGNFGKPYAGLKSVCLEVFYIIAKHYMDLRKEVT